MSFASSQCRGSKPSNFTILLVFLPLLAYFKRSAFQNKQIVVWNLAFWSQKFHGIFEKPKIYSTTVIIFSMHCPLLDQNAGNWWRKAYGDKVPVFIRSAVICIFWPSKVSSQKTFQENRYSRRSSESLKNKKSRLHWQWSCLCSRMPIRITFQWTPTGKRKRVRLKIT